MLTQTMVQTPEKAGFAWTFVLDCLLVAAVVALLAAVLLTLTSKPAQARMARLYAQQFSLRQENECPSVFGNEFWFACAGEVRRAAGSHPEL